MAAGPAVFSPLFYLALVALECSLFDVRLLLVRANPRFRSHLLDLSLASVLPSHRSADPTRPTRLIASKAPAISAAATPQAAFSLLSLSN